MKKTIITVFMIIGVVVLGFVGFNLVLGGNGVINTAYNTVATTINSQGAKLGLGNLLPENAGSKADKVTDVDVEGGGTTPADPVGP